MTTSSFAPARFSPSSSPVRRILALFSLTLAWLCANGAVWDVAQVFAWSRMFTGYAEALPVGTALRETFDPAKPCHLCEAIARAKQTSTKQPAAAPAATVKLILALELPADPVVERSVSAWPRSAPSSSVSWTAAVPVPPPRFAAA